MEITYFGHSAFKIAGKDITIVTDPFEPIQTGLNLPKVEADVVTVSHQHKDHNNVKGVKGTPLCFDSPGEYEIKESEITGINSWHDEKEGKERGTNTIFSFKVDGIGICHLGDLGVGLTTDQIEKIDGVDILMIPVGGKDTIGPKEAVKVISEIEPKIVIPMHYKNGKITDIEPIDNFLKEIGKTAKTQDKIKIQKRDLPTETDVIVLKN